jgi:hypothetical protein
MEQAQHQALPSWLLVKKDDGNLPLEEHVASSIVPTESDGFEGKWWFSLKRINSAVPRILPIALVCCVLLMFLNVALIVKIENDREDLSEQYRNLYIEQKKVAEMVERTLSRQAAINEIVTKEVDRRLQLEKKKIQE